MEKGARKVQATAETSTTDRAPDLLKETKTK